MMAKTTASAAGLVDMMVCTLAACKEGEREGGREGGSRVAGGGVTFMIDQAMK